MTNENSRFAVLIDADNVSAKYITAILDEMTKHGTVTYKRIYGDWTSSQTSKWKDVLAESAVTPIQQFANTAGKNATDSTLIIDAMDILYTGNVDGFCIVSSDSDFTRLATRLRESGMMVIGMGEEKTPRSFRAACSVFTNLELLVEDESTDQTKSPDKQPAKRGNIVSKKKIVNLITEIVNEDEEKGRATSLAEIGNRLTNKYPDFDTRNYGYTLLSKFLESFENFHLEKSSNNVTVSLANAASSREAVSEFVVQRLREEGDGYDLSLLGTDVHDRFPHFDVREHGYSQFSKYVKSISGVDIDDAGQAYLIEE